MIFETLKETVGDFLKETFEIDDDTYETYLRVPHLHVRREFLNVEITQSAIDGWYSRSISVIFDDLKNIEKRVPFLHAAYDAMLTFGAIDNVLTFRDCGGFNAYYLSAMGKMHVVPSDIRSISLSIAEMINGRYDVVPIENMYGTIIMYEVLEKAVDPMLMLKQISKRAAKCLITTDHFKKCKSNTRMLRKNKSNANFVQTWLKWFGFDEIVTMKELIVGCRSS
ncbi:MAG: hypothetical protein ACTSRA_00890 [Promethearchaeota archaeon]|nr:MAG: hypothetical protein [Helarchaeota virus Nidhogg Meg22_1012]URC17334.1 MAG: hypothetical protein [Helarchaeota virus Nidhogg Meg22_1214]